MAGSSPAMTIDRVEVPAKHGTFTILWESNPNRTQRCPQLLAAKRCARFGSKKMTALRLPHGRARLVVMDHSTLPDSDRLTARIGRALRRARLFALIERAWPRLVLASSIIALFLITSWLGLWPLMPDVLRFALVGLFAIALIGALIWLVRTPRPAREENLARVERHSGLSGRPLAALDDAPFDTSSAQGRALWQAHQRAMAETVKKLSAGLPAPRTERFDPWALRAPVLLALVVAFFVAGSQRDERILSAFAPPTAAPTVPVRLDVWATPPAYTGLPPRTLLSGTDLGAETPEMLGASLPTGSRLTILISNPEGITTSLAPMDGSAAHSLAGDEGTSGPSNLETLVERDTVLTIASARDTISIPLLVTPDTPPTIRFADDPEATTSGAMKLSYVARDDYGLTSAHAEIEPADEEFADATPLIEPPIVSLVLPSGSANGMDSEPVETTRDLSAHPWAGLSVDLTLVARDGADQEATSETRTFTLPERTFHQPLARALVEQRRLLAVNTQTQVQVLTALEGLALAADIFMEDQISAFLALTVTTQRLRHADTNEELLSVVDMLWQLALQVEDGDLSLAAERLREAEEALSQALEEGASEEEISQLMDELRQAFQEYMQALAEQMQQSDFSQMSPDAQMLDPQSMQDLMDQIQELSELGAADAARELLEQLRQQLEQLRGAQPMQAQEPSEAEQALREAVQELQAITREQQRLLDETFPFSGEAQRPRVSPQNPFSQPNDPRPSDPRPSDPDAQNGQNDQNGQNSGPREPQPAPDPLGDLSEQQQTLREQLEQLMDQLRDLGLDPSQLGEAGDAMGSAGDLLERGSPTGALSEQGRALEALRDGAQDMAQQLAQQGEEQGEGQGQQPGQGLGQGGPRLFFGPQGDGQRGFDPLGRPQRATGPQDGERVRIPEESDIQRARDILNEIQRRLGERTRPQTERDYLDRLIERF